MNSRFFLLIFLSTFMAGVYASSAEDIIMGGRLYDKWWADTGLAEPTGTHPSYPATGKKKGANSWRCKECHGWDYRGKDGAYGKGSHYTGFKGIRDKAGAKPELILSILKNEHHPYAGKIPDNTLELIAQFVSAGQVDMMKYIDGGKKVNGNSSKGKSLYVGQCRRCHGKQGKALNVTNKKGETQSVGGLSNKNPWEILHKIRFGHPGATMGMKQMHKSSKAMGSHHRGRMKMWEAMPPMYEKLSVEEQVDLLTYLQTLPKP